MDETQGPLPQTPGPLDPLPDSVSIPAAMVEDWFAIPPQATLTLDLRREDLDHFYSSINRCIEAQSVFQDSMIDYTGGRVDTANAKLRSAQRKLIEAQNALRQFMTSIMASATRRPS